MPFSDVRRKGTLEMAEAQPESDLPELASRRGRRRRLWPQRWRWRVSLILALSLLALFIVAWLNREQIAGDLIDDALDANGIEGTYEIVSIGPQEQVIENLVIGDPDAPNLTAERVIIGIRYRLGTPEIGRVELVGPRLYGTFVNGEFSLGALDPLVFPESDEPAGLPALDVAIRDGRGLIESDYGAIGLKIDGEGRLDSGFAGILAATGPGLGTENCRAENATLYGEITTSRGEPAFDGPVRLSGFECGEIAVGSAEIAAEIGLASDFSSLDADLGFDSERLAYSDMSLDELAGTSRLTLGLNTGPDGGLGNLALDHDLAGTRYAGAGFEIAELSLEGSMRARDGFATGNWNANFGGEGVDFDAASADAIRSARVSAEGTLAEPLLAKLERGLARALNDGRFAGAMTLRTNPDNTSIIIPEARLRSGEGETVLALSRVSYSSRGQRLSGNLLTGGADLPRINGRVEQVSGGDLAMRLSMAEYRQGSDSLAIPRVSVRRTPSGRFSFNGIVEANGAIPGGNVEGLLLPLDGTWSQGAGLAVGTACSDVRIRSLQYAQLGLQGRAITLCPADGRAMLTYRDALDIAVSSDDLDLAGDLAGTPARITARRAVMRYPGPFTIEGLDAVLGPDDNAIRLSMNALQGEFAQSVGGSFEGGRAGLDAVPLDVGDLEGVWTYQDSILRISEGDFTLTERTGPGLAPQERFEPMVARGAALKLADNVITAEAPMRLATGGQQITQVSVRHDLSSGIGRADLDVPGVSFGDNLQPEDLSYLASGVIALAEGTVSGDGRIEWNGSDVSSSGTFRSDSLDFAAAFGPVRGVSGEIEFTDLLSLTTAPDQRLEIASVNPGIEALGGTVVFSLQGGQVVNVNEGRWPFMGGTLILRPTRIDFLAGEGQSYVFEIVGLDAAAFVAQMELDNIGASGIFDGTIPIFFDANGNGLISGGLLISRPPGGNVSYVGELTYEDMGAIANYAFRSLRSLDFTQMAVELDGSVAGEIITKFQIDGVRQGEGAERNFLTRQLGKLPVRFNINVRSENFSQLALVARGISDPTAFGDAVDQGLFEIRDGQIIRRPDPETELDSNPEPIPENELSPAEAALRDESDVQHSESDEMP